MGDRSRQSSRGRGADRHRAKRAEALRNLLRPGEAPMVTNGSVLVTDGRVVFLDRVAPHVSVQKEVRDALAFDEIERWALGERHDHRPLLRLDHPPHAAVEHVPAHRVLWFRWGNAEGLVSRRTTVLGFNVQRDPALQHILERLRRDGVPEGAPFVIKPWGTREERLGPSVAYLVKDEGRWLRRRRRPGSLRGRPSSRRPYAP